MLRKIELKNFKCFESLSLACSPLTLLCGLNGMGKSSVAIRKGPLLSFPTEEPLLSFPTFVIGNPEFSLAGLFLH